MRDPTWLVPGAASRERGLVLHHQWDREEEAEAGGWGCLAQRWTQEETAELAEGFVLCT
jgi:hypothetical protein